MVDLETLARLMRPLVEPYDDLYFDECAFLWYEMAEDGCSIESAGATTSYVGDGTLRQQKKAPPQTLQEVLDLDDERPDQIVPAFEEDDHEPVPELVARWVDQFEDITASDILDLRSAEDVMDWGIREGIFPGQTFLVCVSFPTWHRSGWEHIEYDFEIDSVILDRVPLDAGLRTLEQLLEEQARGQRLSEEEAALTREAQRLDVDRMYVSRSWYYATRGWDEMASPDGVRYTLCTSRSHLDSRRSGCTFLVSGDSDRGDGAAAMAKLRAAVAERYPHVLERLDKLPQRHG
jgi:hypothetical protein